MFPSTRGCSTTYGTLKILPTKPLIRPDVPVCAFLLCLRVTQDTSCRCFVGESWRGCPSDTSGVSCDTRNRITSHDMKHVFLCFLHQLTNIHIWLEKTFCVQILRVSDLYYNYSTGRQNELFLRLRLTCSVSVWDKVMN